MIYQDFCDICLHLLLLLICRPLILLTLLLYLPYTTWCSHHWPFWQVLSCLRYIHTMIRQFFSSQLAINTLVRMRFSTWMCGKTSCNYLFNITIFIFDWFTFYYGLMVQIYAYLRSIQHIHMLFRLALCFFAVVHCKMSMLTYWPKLLIHSQDWDRQSPTQVITELCGFVTILSGTFLLHKTKDMVDGMLFILFYWKIGWQCHSWLNMTCIHWVLVVMLTAFTCLVLL